MACIRLSPDTCFLHESGSRPLGKVWEMILATRHTGIVVQDLEKSLRFWRDFMGMEVVIDFREEGEFIDTVQRLEGVRLRMVKLRAADGTMIQLLKDDAHSPNGRGHEELCDYGIRHIAFTVPDIDHSWRVLRDANCDVLSEPVTSPDGKAKLFFARDPEGNYLEIVQVIDPPVSSGCRIDTRYRRIVSDIPHPDSAALIEELRRIEPRSMSGTPPVVWNRAEGFQIWDVRGNKWIDFTSAVVLANAGHSNPRIARAVREQLETHLWHNYCNPSEIRLRTVKAIQGITPPYLDKVFLLTTGSEAVECAIKLMRVHGRSADPEKIHILSFRNSFHGRTMGAQMAGGYVDQQEWMGAKPYGFHHIPFPDCARCPWGRSEYANCGRECLERSLMQLKIEHGLFAGAISETFQGPTAAFMPPDYVQALREWATANNVLLTFDEIQAGFGRTGRWFGFEHYGVEADLVCMGKGMTSCLPMSAVAGRGAILDMAEQGEMSSTHTGNPLCCAAAMANIEAIRNDGLMDNAAALEPGVRGLLSDMQSRFPETVRTINGRGLVWAVLLGKPETRELDVELAKRVTTRCMEKGLLMLQTNRGTLKIAPPLCITREALTEGIQVIEEALAECAGALRGVSE